MSDLSTLQRWIGELGFDVATEPSGALRLLPRGADASRRQPPLFVQWSQNWILLAVLPVWRRDEPVPDDVHLQLLLANREMRLAKFALDAEDDVVLCAELPTESLQYDEFADAVTRIRGYVRTWREKMGLTSG